MAAGVPTNQILDQNNFNAVISTRSNLRLSGCCYLSMEMRLNGGDQLTHRARNEPTPLDRNVEQRTASPSPLTLVHDRAIASFVTPSQSPNIVAKRDLDHTPAHLLEGLCGTAKCDRAELELTPYSANTTEYTVSDQAMAALSVVMRTASRQSLGR